MPSFSCKSCFRIKSYSGTSVCMERWCSELKMWEQPPSVPQDSLKPLKGSDTGNISTWEVDAGKLP